MPKIPTFITEARPTAEVGSVTSNLQIPLNTVAGALKPLTDAVVKYKTAEQNASNKTEALELENKAVIKLNDLSQDISIKYTNSDEANKFLMEKSKAIRDEFASQASNSKVQTLFTNSYLLEEQKKIYSVDNKVHTNLINKRSVASSVKEQHLLTEAIYGDNDLAKQELPNDLKLLYENDYIDGLMTVKNYETKIASIPNLVATFEVQKDITKDPVQTFVNLDEGKYEGLFIDDREQLKREAALEAKPILKENMINYITALEDGKDIGINEAAIKSIYGEKVFSDFKETQNNTKKVSVFKTAIFNSKIGDEQNILDMFELKSGNYAQDKQYKEKVKDFISQKNQLIEKDAATLILSHNSIVRDNFDAYNSATGDAKQLLFKKYINSVVQAQEDMDIDPTLIKVLPVSFAQKVAMDYNSQPTENKIGYLQTLEEQYGEQYGRVLNELTAQGLPVTAKLVSYFNDENFAVLATSIDTKEEKVRLDDYLKTQTNLSFNDINQSIADELEDFRNAVMFSNKMNTTKANDELGDIQDIITYIAINKLSAGMKESKAITQATNYINNNFVLEDTYFIPRNYDNDRLSPRHIEFIQDKVEYIKDRHLQDFDMMPFKSTNPDISDKDLNDEMLEQAQDNGVWINSADGNGLVFAIEFSDGSLGLVQNKKGELLQVNFDDDSYKLPTTDIDMDIRNLKKEELPSGA